MKKTHGAKSPTNISWDTIDNVKKPVVTIFFKNNLYPAIYLKKSVPTFYEPFILFVSMYNTNCYQEKTTIKKAFIRMNENKS